MTLDQANEAMWYGKTVLLSGVEYKLTGVIKQKHPTKSEWYYQARLQDIKANSTVIENLEKVTEK